MNSHLSSEFLRQMLVKQTSFVQLHLADIYKLIENNLS